MRSGQELINPVAWSTLRQDMADGLSGRWLGLGSGAAGSSRGAGGVRAQHAGEERREMLRDEPMEMSER
jgi:hypothetical protein